MYYIIVSDKIKTGNIGETLAAEFFVEKGFKILERNYRHGHAEIDLIVQREDWVLFIEVKTRSTFEYGEPEDFVTHRKVQKMYEAAEEWIFSTDWRGHIRFDIVSVKLTGGVPEIRHFEDAIN
jgi:putative endonuclease